MTALLTRLSIRIKLVLLAGVPVVGALVLAAMVVRDAGERSRAAAALGSIEDVAQLSMRISATVRALQSERAQVALSEGLSAAQHVEPDAGPFETELQATYAETDATVADLERFLGGRDLSALPPRLARDLGDALGKVAKRQGFRARIEHEDVPVDDVLAFYGPPDDALINATAALTQLSDDGELLRTISSLVALSELTERSSCEHALLSYVFSANQFPPGAFKRLVTLSTEQQVYMEEFRASAADADARQYDDAQEQPAATVARDLRGKALASTDDTLTMDAHTWFLAQGSYIASLHQVQTGLMGRISGVATAKMAATQQQVRAGFGLSALVVLLSVGLAGLIARGITRAVLGLARAAERVRVTRDYSTRATKTSSDELGALTDAFNEMLQGIQGRDRELEEHKQGLETTVAKRTAELTARNEAMRLVLDNVDQGLATFRLDGTLDPERSRMLDKWFGTPEPGTTFIDHLGARDPQKKAVLQVTWEMVVEDVLPLEVTMAQLPRSMVQAGSHYALGWKPVMSGDTLQGALLVVTDVTADVQARKEHAAQQEHIAIFSHIASDREGFAALVTEVGGLIARLKQGTADVKAAMALLHTIKGTSAIWNLTSVATLAHQLESSVVESGEPPTQADAGLLYEAWDGVLARATTFLGVTRDRVEVTRAELQDLAAVARARPEDLARKVELMMQEPVASSFRRIGEQVGRLAKRLEKPVPRVIVDDGNIRLPSSRFGGFWTSSIHIVRNIMDHGIESPSERQVLGKTPEGEITLRAALTSDRIVISFSDDGRGIAWEKVSKKARALGMPHGTPAELRDALFSSGFSTREEATDISGRGVGLSAVAECCAALGGTIDIASNPKQGTTFTFSFPREKNEHSLPPSMLSRLPSSTSRHGLS